MGLNLQWSRAALHYALRVIILLGFGYYILYLWKTDQMHYYIAPRMMGLIFWSGIALLVLATFQFYMLLGQLLRTNETDAGEDAQNHVECDCPQCVVPGQVYMTEANVAETSRSGGRHWKQVAGYSLLILPLLIAFILPDEALSTEIAAKKGMNLSTLASVEAKRSGDEELRQKLATEGGVVGETEPVEFDPSKPRITMEGVPGEENTMIYGGKNGVPRFVSMGDFDRDFAIFSAYVYPQDVIRVEDSKFMEYLTSFDLFLEQFQGKKVEISGFVYRDDEMKADQFVIGRLAVQCCSADAAPYGIMVQHRDAKRFANNDWVRVTGEVTKTQHNENEILMLRVLDAVAIPTPKNQYVYPNYDFLQK